MTAYAGMGFLFDAVLYGKLSLAVFSFDINAYGACHAVETFERMKVRSEKMRTNEMSDPGPSRCGGACERLDGTL